MGNIRNNAKSVRVSEYPDGNHRVQVFTRGTSDLDAQFLSLSKEEMRVLAHALSRYNVGDLPSDIVELDDTSPKYQKSITEWGFRNSS